MSETKYVVKTAESNKIYLGASTAPQTLVGTTGDREGMLSVDSNYLYYCNEDYTGVSGPVDIWKSVELSPVTTATYRALMSQTGVISGNSIFSFDGALIVGETYTIAGYGPGDDFSNVANVISGTINTNGCVFIATAERPLVWTNISQLESSGNLVVQVLENTLGFDIEWTIFGPGIYIGYRTYGGSNGLFNDFPRDQVSAMISQSSIIVQNAPPSDQLQQFVGPVTLGSKDDTITVLNYNWTTAEAANNFLYYTPIEIRMNKNIDTTPVVINGAIQSFFPFAWVSFTFVDSIYGFVDSIYSDVDTVVNDITELVALLNSNTNTNYFGTFADDGDGGVTLTMPTNLKKQFSPNGTLTIDVFSD